MSALDDRDIAMIRRMNIDDLRQLPRLHADGTESDTQRERANLALTHLFRRLYFESPWTDPDVGSLVSSDSDGHINGMMGVVARRVRLGDRILRMAVCSELYVEPKSRPRMVGIQLVRQFLKGAQDLSFTDISNAKSRMIWQRLGGYAVALYNVNWLRILRPASFCPALLESRGPFGRFLSVAFKPAANAIDGLLARTSKNPLHAIHPLLLQSESLTTSIVADDFQRFMSDDILCPVYDADCLAWIFSRLDYLSRDAGPSYQTAVTDGRGNVLGWYIYQVRRGGIGRVAQLVASEATIQDVLRHLFSHASERGAAALLGRLQPCYLQALIDSGCLLRPRGSYTLVHSRDEALIDLFQQNRVFLTLLEGESCLDIWNAPLKALAALPPTSAPEEESEKGEERSQPSEPLVPALSLE